MAVCCARHDIHQCVLYQLCSSASFSGSLDRWLNGGSTQAWGALCSADLRLYDIALSPVRLSGDSHAVQSIHCVPCCVLQSELLVEAAEVYNCTANFCENGGSCVSGTCNCSFTGFNGTRCTSGKHMLSSAVVAWSSCVRGLQMHSSTPCRNCFLQTVLPYPPAPLCSS